MDDTVTEEPEPFHFRIADISPTPDDETLAVITMALTEAWPRPSTAAATSITIDTDWRFGRRRWRARQIPRRTWGR